MVSLEQVRLLETKVAKAIEYVKRITGENNLLKEKLDTYQQRIDELEVLVQRFKEDQSDIEDGILAALDRLNQFEDAIEKSLAVPAEVPAAEVPVVEISPDLPAPEAPVSVPEAAVSEAAEAAADTGELDIF
jgi:FtsZ-binding cell division protein ZapB